MALSAYGGIANPTSTTETTNATIDRYIPARMLEVAKYEAVLYGLATKVPIPEGESKTCTFIKYPHLAVPANPLSEGGSGDATAMATSRVSCVTETWGAYVVVSSLAQYISRGSPIDIASTRLGVQAARTIDREIVHVLLRGTKVIFGGSATARGSLTANDTITTAMMRKARAYIKRQGAPYYSGNKLALVSGPEVCADIQADNTFLQAASYQRFDILTSGEVGEWMGFRINESNTIPSLTLSGTTVTVDDVALEATETVMANGTYTVVLTVYDADGFENIHRAQSKACVMDDGGSNDVITVVVPALSATNLAYSIYCGLSTAVLTLQKERITTAGTYRISGNGGATDATKGIAYSTTGGSLPGSPATGVTVHPVFWFGSEYFKCTELGKIKTYRTSGAQKSDPLNRFQTVGWVIEGFRALITDETFGGRFEVASLN